MSDALDNWRWRNPLPQGNPIDGVAFGAGIFVAVTRARTIMTSPNGVDWDLSNVEADLHRVHYLNGTFVAVGSYGAILTSPTGAAGTWTSAVSGTSHAFLDVAYGNNLFVAVGQCGAISTSPDAAAWTAGGSGIAAIDLENLYAITFGHGKFVAVGGHGTILTSPDGYTWTDRSLGGDEVIAGVACNAAGFVAVRSDGTIWNSTDGTTWTVSTLSPTSHVLSVDFEGGEFVAVGCVGGNDLEDAAIWRSGDGHNWSVLAVPGNDELLGSAYGNGVFVAVGLNGTILTTDGVVWTKRNSDSSYDLCGAAYGAGTVVFVGSHRGKYGIPERAVLLTSSDFENWTSADPGIKGGLTGVLYSGSATVPGIFVAVGGDPPILTSSDGKSWNTKRTAGSAGAVAYGNGTFVAVGVNGTILTSADGSTWAQSVSGTGGWLLGAAFGNGKFVAVGENGTILTSADGSTWAQSVSGTNRRLCGVAFGNGVFVAVGERRLVLRSTDGVSWNQQVVPVGNDWCFAVVYEQGTFVAVGSDGLVMTSPDGGVWTIRDSRVANNLLCATYGNGSFFVGGSGAKILQAELFQPLKFKSLAPSVKSPQKPGARVRWACVATGEPGLQYAFSIVNKVRRVPIRRQKLVYSPKNSMVASFDAPGTYVVTVYVKSPHGDVVRKSSAEFKIRA